MNNAIIPLLNTLLKEQGPRHGKAMLSNLTLLRNLLADYAPQYRAERNLLLRAVEEHIPAEIVAQAKQGEALDPLLIGRWVKRLETDHGIAPENAQWAVKAWIEALGLKMAPDSQRSSPANGTEVVPPVSPPVRGLAVEQNRLLAIMLDVKCPPQERAKAGREINQVPGGDPRSGVVDFNWGEDYWCLVPKGEFSYQGKPAKIDYDFWIARYPVTYAQFQLFIGAPDGYRNPEWWKDLHEDGRKHLRKGVWEQHFKFDNHPHEQVSWFEAVAFCRWLNALTLMRPASGVYPLPTASLGEGVKYQIRLPLETEWEKAASWDVKVSKARVYPWGDTFDTTKANTCVGGRIHTAAVGIYPQGASPCGALDMSGNVWEWCLNESGSGQVNIGSDKRRGLRGGSWDIVDGGARAAVRFISAPSYRYDGYGFRVVVAPISL